MSMTPVPVCWQTTVTAENKKECALAHSRAEARLPWQPSTLAPSAHPRGAFLSYGNEVSYTIKNRKCISLSETLPVLAFPKIGKEYRFFYS